MAQSLPLNLQVDDSDPNFSYSAGDWQEVTGSTRQFDSNVHITSTYGATISFRYNAEAFVLYGTTPAGGNNVIFDVSIDGGSPTNITKACDTDDQFEVDLFESPIMEFTVHTVVITNRGGGMDAVFMFDNLILYSDSITPSMASPLALEPPIITSSVTPISTQLRAPIPSTALAIQHQSIPPQNLSNTGVLQPSTSSTTSPATTTSISSSSQNATEPASVSNSSTFITTVVSESTGIFSKADPGRSTAIFTQTFSTSFLASSETGSTAVATSPPRLGTVLAGCFGGLAFLLLVIAAILAVWRRRRKNSRALLEEDGKRLVLKKSRNGKPSIIPQPFRLSTPHSPTSPGTSPSPGQSPVMSEKRGYLKYNALNPDHDSEPEATAGPSNSSGDQVQVPSHAPLTQSPNRGFSSAAQSDSATNILSHRRSATIFDATDEETTACSPQTISSSSERTHDAPPAYQPTRLSHFDTSSQIRNDHTSPPSADEE